MGVMSKKHTKGLDEIKENVFKGHALTYLKYVTIASFDPRQL